MSDADSHSKLYKLFNEALNAEVPKQYIRNLDISEDLRKELEKLLAGFDDAGGFLSSLHMDSDIARRFLDTIGGLEKGSRISEFKILERLGGGAFGVVYLAEQESLARKVALKVTPNQGEEGRTLAQLEHEHIVAVHSEEVLEKESLRLVCMPVIGGADLAKVLAHLGGGCLDGESLVEAIRACSCLESEASASAIKFQERLQSSLYSEACLLILKPIVDALAYAHKRNVLHLDLKPANILLDTFGRPKLADFNVSTSKGGRVIGGTSGFMSPEHEHRLRVGEGEPLDERSDLYSVGHLLETLIERNDQPFADDLLWGVINSCKVPQAEGRIASAEKLSEGIQNALQVKRVQRALPKIPWGLSWYKKLSLVHVMLLMLIPQFLGSLVNIFYNYHSIVVRLDERQIASFADALMFYNMTAYPLCFGWLLYRTFILVRMLNVLDFTHRGESRMQNLRAKALGLLRDLVLATTVGWLPGGIFFPLYICLGAGEWDPSLFFRFNLSFFSSWLVAMPYSFLLVAFYIVRILYPKLWSSFTPLKGAKHELAPLNFLFTFALFAVGGVPLLAAITSLFETYPSTGYGQQTIVALFIFFGMLGFALGFYLISYLRSIVAVFMNLPGEG